MGSLLAVVSDGTVRPGGLSVRGDVGHSDSRLPQPTIQLAFRNKGFQHFTVHSQFFFFLFNLTPKFIITRKRHFKIP